MKEEMWDNLALYKADWMRVLADVGLGAAAISRAIELAELNGLFDPAVASMAVSVALAEQAGAACTSEAAPKPD